MTCLIFTHTSFALPAVITMLSPLTSIVWTASSPLSFTPAPPEQLGWQTLHLTKHSLCSASVNKRVGKSHFTTWSFFLGSSIVLCRSCSPALAWSCETIHCQHPSPGVGGHQVLLLSPCSGRKCLAGVFCDKEIAGQTLGCCYHPC